jgi:spermidine/putrescine transport system permease protein
MKKIAFSILLSIMVLSGCQTDKPTLKIFSWGAYIDTTVITTFEKEYHCNVIYDMFESNEAMYTKLLSGEKYDVLVPSDYMVQRLIEEESLLPLDYDLLPNASGIIPQLMKREFDPVNTYSVPYFWGNVGLIYNTTIVDPNDLSQGWNLLRNTAYKSQIFVYDSERDVFMVALKALGYSMNTQNQSQLDQAYSWLEDLNNTMDPVYATDDVIDNMISGNKAIAMVYSGDAAYIMAENPDMAYLVPQQGTNFWIDNMVIFKDATQLDLAHKWINTMLSPDVAKLNSVFVGYSSPIQSVYDELKDSDFAGLDAYTPRLDYSKDEVFHYDEKIKLIISELWVKVKALN